MEIKKVKTPVYKNIIDGYKEVNIYITSDGQKFSERDKDDANRHEHRLNYEKRLSNIKQVTIENIFDMVPEKWFYASTKEDLDFLTNLKEDKYRKVEINGDLKNGEWIGCYVFDCGDSGETAMYYTLSYVMSKTVKFLEDVMSKTNLTISDDYEGLNRQDTSD